MSKNFRESFAGGKVMPPSKNVTGLVFVALALTVTSLQHINSTALWSTVSVAVILAAVSLVALALLKPPYRLWFKFGLYLHRVVNPIGTFSVFALGPVFYGGAVC